MNIFITGINGYLGSELAKELRNIGISVSGCDIIGPFDSDVHHSDIRSKNILKIMPNRVDVIIHLAALSSDKLCRNNEYDCFDLNVMGTLNIMHCAELKNCKQLIFSSSEWVYENSDDHLINNEKTLIDPFLIKSEYALSKLTSELIMKQKYSQSSFDITILRFGIIYGGGRKSGSAVESIVNQILKKDILEIGSKKTGRYFIHYKDIISGIISSIDFNGFNIFNLAGDEFIELGKIIQITLEKIKKNIKVIEKNKSEHSRRMVSNKSAKNLLKWKPQIKIEQGIDEILSHY